MAGQPALRRFVVLSSATACLVAAYAETGHAQRRRRSSNNYSSLYRTLTYSRAQQELKLTDTQKKEIEALAKKSQFGRDQYTPFVTRLQAAKTDSDKSKIRAEMKEAADKYRKEMEDRGLKVLTADQRTRFQELRYRLAGSRAILMTSAIDELKITDDQKKKIESVLKERTNAYYKVDRRKRAESDFLAKFKAEWDPKTYAVLTPEQRTQWQKMIGQPPSWEKGSTSSSSTTTKSTTSDSKTVRRPAKSVPVGSYVASFDAKNGGATSAEPKTSYGAPAGKGKPKLQNPKEQKNISFSFDKAPWKIVIEQFAKKAGLRLDAPEVPAGTFNYRDTTVYTPTQALDVINGYLLAKKFILIRRGKVLVVHNLEKPVPQSIIPDVKAEDLPYRGNNELLRVTFEIDPLADIKQAKIEVEEVQGGADNGYSKTIAFSTASRLIVTDIGSQLTKIAGLLEKVISKTDKTELSFKAFQLIHISASDAETILKQQLNAQQTVRNVSRGGGADGGGDRRAQFMQMMMARRGGRSSRGSSRFGGSGTTGSSRTTGDASVRVTSDERTNNVLVLAPMTKVSMAEKIVKAIDVPLNSEDQQRYNRRNNVPYLKVYKVTKVNSTEVTKTLTALLPEGAVINEDGYNHTIHIWGNDELQEIAKELIEKMDGGGDGGIEMATITVKNRDVVQVANSLVAMFADERTSPPMIQADTQHRQLLVKASKGTVAKIRDFVAKLDANAGPQFTAGTINDNMLRVPINGDPKQFMETLQKVWNSSSVSNGSVLNVVPIREQSPIRARMDSTGRRISPGFRPDADRNSRGFVPAGNNNGKKQPIRQPNNGNNRGTTDLSSNRGEKSPMSYGELYAIHTPAFGRFKKDDKVSATTTTVAKDEKSNTNAAQPGANGKSGITVTFQNGQLVVFSQDKQALANLNRMISQLQTLMPNKPSWTVFYLQASDATETANMLSQLFPSSSVTETASSGSMFGGLTGGIRSFGNTLMDMSGVNSLGTVDSLKIIPDIRANALFVSGSYSKVNDVREVLKVLDATDIPSGARDRLPRMIPVRYANVNEVAQNIREVFAAEMQPSRGGGSQFNPLQMLMGNRGGRGSRGGRSSGGGSRQQPQIQLTLGVDERTGHVLVSCDDSLFQKVEQFVYDLDKTAYEAQPTTRVVQLQHARASVVTQTLTAMYPNVSVTVSSNSARNNNNNRNQSSNNSSNNSNSSSDDARRRAMRGAMMMQMMQQRGQDGDRGSSSPFGSRGGRGGFDFGRGRGGFSGFGGGRSSRGGFGGFGGFGRGRRGR